MAKEAKVELKQMKIDYTNLQKAKKVTDNENVRLKGVDDELVKAKESINTEQAKLVTLQKQYADLLKKTKDLEQSAESYEDPTELKEKNNGHHKKSSELTCAFDRRCPR